MARLHEYKAKQLIAEHGLTIPRGEVVTHAAEAVAAVRRLGRPVVLKVQAWMTGRAAKGGIQFADSPEQAEVVAERLLSMRFGNFPVTELLVEEQISIDRELFVSLSIDDAAAAPVLLLDFEGGSGIEERADTVIRIPVSALLSGEPSGGSSGGPDDAGDVDREHIAGIVSDAGFDQPLRDRLVDAILKVPQIARQFDARSLEINPLVTTTDGRVIAADCRMTVDDYAVFRHPELGIEIARELDHPPTELERIAYAVEQNDHRGTFYFAQLPVDDRSAGVPADVKTSTDADDVKTQAFGSRRLLVGFHGAGGGGSMMSMDAVTNAGFAPANFCDTSGNPSAAKVYRAARIILSQPALVGYFASGSGVASQEQYHSAYGMAKAFLELNLDIPAVIRLGGNSEERACKILHECCSDLPGTVEAYGKDDTPSFCADRFVELIKHSNVLWTPRPRRIPEYVGRCDCWTLGTGSMGGRLWIDIDRCDPDITEVIVRFGGGVFRNSGGRPTLAIAEEDLYLRDSELIACEIECRRVGRPVLFVDLPIDGIDTESASATVGAYIEEKGSDG